MNTNFLKLDSYVRQLLQVENPYADFQRIFNHFTSAEELTGSKREAEKPGSKEDIDMEEAPKPKVANSASSASVTAVAYKFEGLCPETQLVHLRTFHQVRDGCSSCSMCRFVCLSHEAPGEYLWVYERMLETMPKARDWLSSKIWHHR